MFTTSLSQADADSPQIVPKPKQIKFVGGTVALDSAAIVIGDRASEPEKYAAETLRETVGKRFAADWPLCNFARNDHAARIRDEFGDKWWDISSYGYGPGGGLHVPAKFRPVVSAGGD